MCQCQRGFKTILLDFGQNRFIYTELVGKVGKNCLSFITRLAAGVTEADSELWFPLLALLRTLTQGQTGIIIQAGYLM